MASNKGINKLSDKALKNLIGKEGDNDKFYADGNGLNIKVTKKGVMTWYFNFRLGGRESTPIKLKLGNYPELSLKTAREKREQCRSWLAEGKDPRHQLYATRQETLKPVRVKDALEYWIKEYAQEKRENVEKHISQLDKHIYPFIGHIPLVECETHYWIECFDRIRKTSPVAAGYIFQMCKQALKFCRVRRYAISNALDDLTINDVGKKQEKRDRVHTNEELGQIFRYSENKKLPEYYRNLLKLLIIFGCRTQELRLSQWGEWDLKNWVWTVPREHSKSDNKIIRPIPNELRLLLQKLYDRNLESGYLLGELKKSATVSQWGRSLWKRLDHKEPWTLHDFRRSLATKLNDLAIAPHVVEQLLGHTMPGVMSIYNRSQYLPEKLVALNIWYEHLQVLSGEFENVVLMKVLSNN